MLGNLHVRFGVGDGVESVLHHENRILREKLGHKRILLNDGQKRRLAEAAAKLGRDLLRQFGTLFSPSTLLKWHRWLVARKYDSSDHRAGDADADRRRSALPRAPGRAAEDVLPQGRLTQRPIRFLA